MNAETNVRYLMIGTIVVGVAILFGWILYGAGCIYNYEFTRFTIIQISIGWGITIGVVCALEYLLGMMYALFGIRNRIGENMGNVEVDNPEY